MYRGFRAKQGCGLGFRARCEHGGGAEAHHNLLVGIRLGKLQLLTVYGRVHKLGGHVRGNP